jgi:pyruvate kinase
MAISKQRSWVPILALSDSLHTARRMSLYWGITSLHSDAVDGPPRDFLKFVVEWGKREKVLASGSRLVIVGSTRWSDEGHDLMLVHAIP